MNKNYIPDDDVIEEMLHTKLTDEKKKELTRLREENTISNKEFQMTTRAQEIWNAFCGELTQEPTDDMKEALATAVREVADRLYTDWAELQHPADVLREIADELEAL